MKYPSFLLVLGLLLGAGCGDDSSPAAGSEGGPCYGNGTCDAGLICSGSNICVLPAGPCDGVTCSGHGTCVDNGGTAECDCDAGYHAEGLTCVEDVSGPCDDVTCSGHGTCVDNGGTAECNCDTGYHAEGLVCVEDGPCDGVTCSGHGTCVDNGGVAECDCDAGYSAVGIECLEGEHKLSGTFTIDNNPDVVNGNPSTDMYDDIEFIPINFTFIFDIINVAYNDNYSRLVYETCITSGPVTMIFTGDSSGTMDQLVNAFGSEPLEFCLIADYAGTATEMDVWNWVSPGSEISYGIEFGSESTELTLDAQGYPEVGPFQITDGIILLRRYENSATTMTDYASGPSSLSFQ